MSEQRNNGIVEYDCTLLMRDHQYTDIAQDNVKLIGIVQGEPHEIWVVLTAAQTTAMPIRKMRYIQLQYSAEGKDFIAGYDVVNWTVRPYRRGSVEDFLLDRQMLCMKGLMIEIGETLP